MDDEDLDFDPYKVLGLTEENSSEDEIKEAAAKKYAVWHRKKNRDCADYARRMRFRIAKASEMLLDLSTKESFDRLREAKRVYEDEMRPIGEKRRRLVREDSTLQGGTTDEPVGEDTLGRESIGDQSTQQQQQTHIVVTSASGRLTTIFASQQQTVVITSDDQQIVVFPRGQSITINGKNITSTPIDMVIDDETNLDQSMNRDVELVQGDTRNRYESSTTQQPQQQQQQRMQTAREHRSGHVSNLANYQREDLGRLKKSIGRKRRKSVGK